MRVRLVDPAIAAKRRLRERGDRARHSSTRFRRFRHRSDNGTQDRWADGLRDGAAYRRDSTDRKTTQANDRDARLKLLQTTASCLWLTTQADLTASEFP